MPRSAVAIFLTTLITVACTGSSDRQGALPGGSTVSEDGLIQVRQRSKGVLFVAPHVGERLQGYRKAQLGEFAVVQKQSSSRSQPGDTEPRLERYLRQEATRQFAEKNGYPIVSGPGPDVFVVDAVLRDMLITPPSAARTGSSPTTIYQSNDSMTYGLQPSDSLTGIPLHRYYAKKHLPGGRYFTKDGKLDWVSIQGAIDQILVVSHQELEGLLSSVQAAEGYAWPPVPTAASVSDDVAAAPLAGAFPSAVGEPIRVGHLADLSGHTGSIGISYAEGIADAVEYVNAHEGVDGKPIELSSVDFGYDLPRARPPPIASGGRRTWWRSSAGGSRAPSC
jgi:hypothetical protein